MASKFGLVFCHDVGVDMGENACLLSKLSSEMGRWINAFRYPQHTTRLL